MVTAAAPEVRSLFNQFSPVFGQSVPPRNAQRASFGAKEDRSTCSVGPRSFRKMDDKGSPALKPRRWIAFLHL
jgi:hypothetical protein